MPREPRQIFAVGPRAAYGFRDTLRVLGQGGLVVFTAAIGEILECILRHDVNYLVVAPALVQRLAAGTLMEDLIDHPGAVGRIYANVEIEAVDADDQPLPAGTEGILRVRSELCTDRYFDDPVATAEVFRGSWFYPGDMGSVSADGRLDITGRTAEVINNGGDKISPHVIEEEMRAQPGIIDATTFGVPDADGMFKIWAAVVSQPQADIGAVMIASRTLLRGQRPEIHRQRRGAAAQCQRQGGVRGTGEDRAGAAAESLAPAAPWRHPAARCNA